MSSETPNHQEPLSLENVSDGIAHIKQEFIIATSKIEKKEESSSVEKEGKEDAKVKNEFPNKGGESLKWVNHNRPKLILEPAQHRLCRSHWCLLPTETSEGKCAFEKCPFSHDVEEFLKNKPQDLGSTCHNFDTYGFCPYGVVCRYGSNHIELNRSVLQHELRKKKYDFSKALKVFKDIKEKGKSKPERKENKISEENGSGEDKPNNNINRIGPASDEDLIRLRPCEKEEVLYFQIDWEDKLYLAPLTTLGNLPYRRVCKRLGADITCSEMALSTRLLQATKSEWALVKRHSSENIFGVQLCGSNTEVMIKAAELLNNEIEMDFVDINMGCPIDLIFSQGAGSALMRRIPALELMVLGMNRVLSCPLTLKMRTGIYKGVNVAHNIIEKAKLWDVSLFTLHGRSKEQRYLKSADWNYIKECASLANPIPLFGNGDVLTYEDYYQCKNDANVSGIMLARGALIKPWIFTEIKEKRHWDISSNERLDLLKEYVNYGLEHWGSDSEGVEKTRRFLLEWLSFLYRYIPFGILERPQKINQRPPQYIGRNDLETLMSSSNSKDWIKISEMLLGPVPKDFEFLPKHKANSWS
ncbi:tRNA-dihydrouridine(47) synthase [NAD(P)(+)]-like [Armadillidium vulgare]|nr:tRNA-dihydrouridine(47) synthase [NAD(P)(+)]-like [Armadillidium vulgare]